MAGSWQCQQRHGHMMDMSVTEHARASASWNTARDGGFSGRSMVWLVACTMGTLSQSVCHAQQEESDGPSHQAGRADGKPSSGEKKKGYDTAQWRVYTDRARELVHKHAYEQAEQFLEKALRHAEKGFGADDPHVASAKQNLAELYRLTKCYEKAAPLYDDALKILKETYGMKDIRVAFALHNVAGFYMVQRKYAKAEEYYLQSLRVKLDAVGPGHTETSSTMFHLSELYWLQHKHDMAVEYGIKALQALKMTGSDMKTYSRKQARTAEMLLRSDQASRAKSILQEMMDVTPEEDWKTRAQTLESMSRVEQALQNYERARNHIDTALQLRDANKVEYPMKYCGCLRILAALNLELMSLSGCTAEERLSLAQESCDIIQRACSWARESLENVVAKGRSSKKDIGACQARLRAQRIALEFAQCMMMKCTQLAYCMSHEDMNQCVKDILHTLEREDVWSKPIPVPSTEEAWFQSLSQTERKRLILIAGLTTHMNKLHQTKNHNDTIDGSDIKSLIDQKRIFPEGIPAWMPSLEH